ncbi:hypothetical protein D3C81_1596260 [compost metagenome]
MISPVGDVVTLFQQLRQLLEEDDFRTALGQQAQTWARSHWSLDLMIGRLLDVYRKVMETSGKA